MTTSSSLYQVRVSKKSILGVRIGVSVRLKQCISETIRVSVRVRIRVRCNREIAP
jgi:hypothetical protein